MSAPWKCPYCSLSAPHEVNATCIAEAIREAVRAEREACAMVCEQFKRRSCAAAIRARGDK